MRFEGNALARFLSAPQQLAALGIEDWDRLVPVARRAGLMARVALAVEGAGGIERVPAPVRPHLRSALTLAEKHGHDIRRELKRLVAVLGPALGTIVLLKGAAYLAANLPPARGRLFSDVDILVPKDKLADVENLLHLAGWSLGDIHPYDNAYYREWMHQLPPLVNAALGSTIDVHHSLVPATARIRLDGAAVLANARALDDGSGLGVLAPADMVLHSAVHMLNDGEYDHGLRDLQDLDLMLRHFGADPEFWPTLIERGRALDLIRPMAYALRYTAEILGTPVPESARREATALLPPWPMRPMMDMAFRHALRSPHPDAADALTTPSLWLLYTRAHYLRMPLTLLLPHLARKTKRRLQNRDAEAPRL